MPQTIPMILFVNWTLIFFSLNLNAQSEVFNTKVSDQVMAERKEKDAYFKSKLSPLAKKERRNFKGLSYFEYQDLFRVKAELEKLPDTEFIQIQKTQNESEKYRKYGWLKFQLDGKNYRLLALQQVSFGSLGRSRNQLFIPFRDASNQESTYKGGRYLEVSLNKKPIEIDFNKAYNPFCVYDPAYICPIPPAENQLEIAIEAGEKNYTTKK